MKIGDTVVLKEGGAGQLIEISMIYRDEGVDIEFTVDCGQYAWSGNVYDIDWPATEEANNTE